MKKTNDFFIKYISMFLNIGVFSCCGTFIILDSLSINYAKKRELKLHQCVESVGSDRTA